MRLRTGGASACLRQCLCITRGAMRDLHHMPGVLDVTTRLVAPPSGHSLFRNAMDEVCPAAADAQAQTSHVNAARRRLLPGDVSQAFLARPVLAALHVQWSQPLLLCGKPLAQPPQSRLILAAIIIATSRAATCSQPPCHVLAPEPLFQLIVSLQELRIRPPVDLVREVCIAYCGVAAGQHALDNHLQGKEE